MRHGGDGKIGRRKQDRSGLGGQLFAEGLCDQPVQSKGKVRPVPLQGTPGGDRHRKALQPIRQLVRPQVRVTVDGSHLRQSIIEAEIA